MAGQDYLAGKRVAIFGFGRQGRALARWLPTLGAEVVVTDSRSATQLGIRRRDFPGVRFYLAGHPDDVLIGVRYICVSGGVPLDLPLLTTAREHGIHFTNDAQLFIERCPAPVIGITGSAGKTTTAALVAEIVERAGYKVWLGGNIGNPLIEELPRIKRGDIVVMELSSFQLELMSIGPQVAAVLNLTPNHLDRHGSIENYINAKANILRFQKASDVAVLGWDDAGSKALESIVQGELLAFSHFDLVPGWRLYARQSAAGGGIRKFRQQPACSLRARRNPLTRRSQCAECARCLRDNGRDGLGD